MTLRDRINEIEADATLTADERRRRVYAAQTQAFLPAMQALAGKALTEGNSIRVEITGAFEHVRDGASWLGVVVAAWKNGERVPIENPVLFRNPPFSGRGDEADMIVSARSLLLSLPAGGR